MSEFTHGYALLIGVSDSSYPAWSLPVAARDVQALQRVLVNPNVCAYPNNDSHIRLLIGVNATCQSILENLSWIATQVSQDPDATLIIYYSGHGWLDISNNQYYLIPYDVKPFDIPNSALSGKDFNNALHKIKAKRLIVFIDSCHAAGMATAKDPPLLDLPSQFIQSSIPKDLISGLERGSGHVVFTSSTGEQKSWIRPDQMMSIYTYHLIEAFQGTNNSRTDSMVHISNVMNYLGKTVPNSARILCNADQTPFFSVVAEDFPIAMLRGGKGVPVPDATDETLGMIDRQVNSNDIDISGQHSVVQIVKAEDYGRIAGVVQSVKQLK